MKDLMLWDPFKEMLDIRDSFDRILNRSFLKRERGDSDFDFTTLSPKISVTEEGDNIVVEADMPGIDKKDISVTVNENTLTIKGETKKEKKEEKKGKYYYNERYYGSFYRTIELPKTVDDKKAKASYKDGVLRIELPIPKEAKEKETKITVE
jgi:HSP20 family protein